MWSLAIYDLRLTADEFFLLTPRQLDALLQRRQRDVDHQELLLAQVCACVVNFSMGHPKEPISPAEFMPSRRLVIEKRPRLRSRQVIADECRRTMQALMERHNKPQVG